MSVHRPVGQHRAGRRGRRAGRRLPALDGLAGRRPQAQEALRRSRSRATPRAAAAHLGPPHRRRAVHDRRRPPRPPPLPRRTRSPRCCGGPAGSWSRSTTCPCASPAWRRHARVDGRRLADRQPQPRPPRATTPTWWPRAGIDERQAPARSWPPARSVGAVLPEVAADARLPAGRPRRWSAGTPDLHTAALGLGRGPRPRGAPGAQHQLVGQLPGRRSRRPTSSARSPASPASTPTGYLVIDNHEVGGLCLAVVPRQLVAPADVAGMLVRRPHRAGGHRRGRGSGNVIFTPWLNGERSPVDDRRARGGFHNLSLATDRARAGRGPSSRAWPTTPAGSSRRSSSFVEPPPRPGADHRRRAPRPTSGARSTPT